MTIRKLKTSRISGVLFVPEWKTADNWIEIVDCEGGLLSPFTHVESCRPFNIQGTHDFWSPFSGRVQFNFLEIVFNSYRGIIQILDLNKNLELTRYHVLIYFKRKRKQEEKGKEKKSRASTGQLVQFYSCCNSDIDIRLLTDRLTYLAGIASDRQPPRRLSCLAVAPFAVAAMAPPLFPECSP